MSTENNPMSEDAFFDMSDDEIMNMSNPPEVNFTSVEDTPTETTEVTEATEPTEPTEPTETTEPVEATETVDSSGSDLEEDNPLEQDDEEIEKSSGPKKKEKEKEDKSTEPTEPTAPVDPEGDGDKDKKKEEPAPVEEPVNYKDAYEKIMAPFKASGKMIQMKSPEEVIALMQKGAHFTQKMMALQPHLKMVKMLENNGLLSEEKISFLIDLDKKDPAAISKFFKDKAIDPLDLDLTEETKYKPGNHTVSDEEMRFDTVLKDVQSTPHGRETVQIIDKQWDRTSQGRVFSEPKILELINQHREDGIYEQITSEIDRLKLLGVIPDNAVFLDAYKSVGDELHKHGRLTINGVPTNQLNQKKPAASPDNSGKPVDEKKPVEQPTRRVIAERPATPKPAAQNNAAAKAAAPPRQSRSKPTVADFNPLDLSDEEFEKQARSFRL